MKLSDMSSGRFNRRNFLQAATATSAAALLGGNLTACGSNPGNASSGGVVTINYWDYYVSQAPWVDNEIKLFEQAHPNIKVKKTTNASNTYDNLFALAVKSNTQPDVFLLPISTPPLNQQVQNGWLLPLDKWADSWKKRFPPQSFIEGSNMFNGHIYSAPMGGHAPWLQLYVNNNVFKAAGLTNPDGSIKLPKTWDDVTNAMDVITKKSNGTTYGYGFGNAEGGDLAFSLEMFVRGAGTPGGAYGSDARTGKYMQGTDRNYQDFINLLLEWKQRGYIYPNSASIGYEVARAYFERGKFGMITTGVWAQPEWTTHKFTDYSLTTLVAPTETPKAYFYYSPGGTLWAASAKTKHPDEAFAWLDWLYSPEAGKRWAQVYSEDLSIYPQNNDPKQIKFQPFAEYAGTSPLSLEGPTVTVRNPEASKVVINPVKPDITDVITGIYTGQIKQGDIASALLDLQHRYQKAQDDGIQQAIQRGVKVKPSDWVFPDWDPTKPYVTKPQSS